MSLLSFYWDEAPWMEDALCSQVDPDLFFPEHFLGWDQLNPESQQIKAAKAVCFHCPVKEDCLRYALKTGEEWGVWGGMTAHERQQYQIERTVA